MNSQITIKPKFFNPNKEWAFIAAAWGDIMCSLSAVFDSGIKKVIYLGDLDQNFLTDFLLCQGFIDEIIYIHRDQLKLDRKGYYDFLSDAIWRNEKFDTDFKLILNDLNLDIEFDKIHNAYQDWYAQHNKIYQIKNLKLPKYILEWAENFLDKNDIENFILVNPYSFQSTDIENHWLHWQEYCEWLTENSNYKFVFVGHGYEPKFSFELENTINLINNLPSNLHVLALALHADSVITTSNSLAHWCNSNKINCTTMMNSFVSEKFNFFGKILNEPTIYKVWHADSLDYAKLITKKINFKSYKNSCELTRNLYVENQLISLNERFLYYLTGKSKSFDEFKMEPIFNSLSFIPFNDFMEDWSQAPDNYDLLLRIAKVLQPESFYEIGARMGHGLITFCYGSPNLNKIGWCDNETYYKFSNYKVEQNILSFNEKYNKQISYSYIESLNDLVAHMVGYQVIVIDGEHTYEGKIRDLNYAKQANPEIILVDDYFWESEVRYAIREWAISNNYQINLIHTFRGLIVFDMTEDQRHIKNLKNNNIIIDSLDTKISRFKI